MTIGPIMLGISGPQLTAQEQDWLAQPQVGGVILFTRNYENIKQLQQLVIQIRESSPTPLLISVDHEGGRVQRFKNEFTHLPAMGSLGELYDAGKIEQACEQAKQCGWLMAAELLAVGIDFSFAPILDLNSGICDIIGNRAFHAKPTIVTKLARQFILGMQQAGMAATGKHFPGHGFVREDTHVSIAKDNRSETHLLDQDIKPFARLIDEGIEAIMPAHVIYTQLDKQPAGFSHFWLQEVLRHSLGFDGVIFSDDLDMTGATAVGSIRKRASLALAAGCDMVLVCNQVDNIINVIDELKNFKFNDTKREQRLEKMQGQFSMNWDELQSSADWQQAVSGVRG